MSKLATFCSEDLGGFYLDVLKDRLYTMKPDSRERRAAQTVLHHIAHGLLRLVAPYLSFTAEEAYKVLQPGRETIFTELYHVYPQVPNAGEVLDTWTLIRSARADVSKALEEARTANLIGSSLQAEVVVKASGARFNALQTLGNDLSFVLITSAAELVQVAGEAEEGVEVVASKYLKCERCWHYCDDVGASAEHPGLCGRCITNLFGNGETRSAA